MNQLRRLRAHLLSLQAELPIDPADLETFASDGTLEAAYGDGMAAYTLRAELHILCKNFSADTLRLMLWVMVWIRADMPPDAKHRLKFDIDILNDQSADVHLTIQSEEIIKAVDTQNGLEIFQCGVPLLGAEPLDAAKWTLFAQGGDHTCQSDPLAEWDNA